MNMDRTHSYGRGEVVKRTDVWDPSVGFISLGRFAPAGSVLLWPHMRFSQDPP